MNDNAQTSTNIASDKLPKERIIWLSEQVDGEIANKLCGQMLLLAVKDSESDISLYINPPGGSVTAGVTIYDTMQFIPRDVAAHGMSLAAFMGQFLLAVGAKGKRYALLYTRIMMHQPLAGIGGTASDITIQAEQFAAIKKEMARLIAQHTGQPAKRIEEDSDRDRWLAAAETKEYGLVDHAVTALKDTVR